MPRALVTGGAGFLGSHFVERLLAEGWDVVCFDSLITGDQENLAHLHTDSRLQFEERDVNEPFEVAGELDWVFHLASPASPIDYLEHPIPTLKVGALGTLNCLEVAREKDAAFFLASTSEVYGDPKVHPQPEGYWGNVNPIGPRSVYDEAKRYAEALTMAYHREHNVNIRIVRIFNTAGPRMRRRDGRAIPTFIDQSLKGQPLTVHGDGGQTRSICYVDDLIEGFWLFVNSSEIGPMNLGNPEEVTITQLAETIRDLTASGSEITYVDRPVDDPEMRRPDISYARKALDWEPRVPLQEGLARTIEWARAAWT